MSQVAPGELNEELARRVTTLQRLLDDERDRADAARRRADALQRAVISGPAGRGPAQVLSVLGLAAHFEGDRPSSAAALRTAALVDPENARLWLLAGRAQRLLDDLRSARASLDRAVELAPRDRAVRLESAEVHARLGRREQLRADVDALWPLRDREVAKVVEWADRTDDEELTDRVLAAAAEGRSATALAAAARRSWRAGDHEGARSLVGGTLADERRAAIDLELLEGDPGVAARLVGALEDADASFLQAVASRLRSRGYLEEALAVRDRAMRSSGPSIGRDDVDRLRGEVLAYRAAGRVDARPPAAGAHAPGRVLHLFGRSRPHVESGYAVRSHYVVRSQREAGLDAVAATQLGFPEGTGGVEHLDGVDYHRIGGPVVRVPERLDRRIDRNVEELVGLVDDLRPAVLQPASDFVNAELALRLRARSGIPVLYEVRGFWEESWLSNQRDEAAGMQAGSYRLRREAETRCMLAADRIVTLAEVMKREIVARGVPADRVDVVPNGVDAERFPGLTRDVALQRQLGLDDADAVLGYISSLSAYEGIDDLLLATARLRERGHRVKVLVVGDGRERRRLEQNAADLGLGAAAVFTGRVPHGDVLRYYGAIDVFVVPRRGDRVCRMVTPLKPFEALATQRALVVSDVEALGEIVQPGVTGLTFAAGDGEDLADVVEPLVADRARREQLGRAGREWVLEERTWEQNGRRYRKILDELGATWT